MVLFPHALLPLPAAKIERFLGVRISGREGIAALVAAFVLRMTRRPDEFQPGDAARLSSVIMDLTAALLARELNAEQHLPPQSRNLASWTTIQAFIQRNLGDPAISPILRCETFR